MSQIQSFKPIAASDARILILGSMPGKASLLAGQYYAHPRNLFWPLLGEILDLDPSLAYEERCLQLKQQKIALWDVLKTCTRSSSLDSDIIMSSVVTNDFGSFLKTHPNIRTICFNGAKAEALFQKHVIPLIAEEAFRLTLLRLPSSSPANASIPYQVKLMQWKAIR